MFLLLIFLAVLPNAQCIQRDIPKENDEALCLDIYSVFFPQTSAESFLVCITGSSISSAKFISHCITHLKLWVIQKPASNPPPLHYVLDIQHAVSFAQGL